MSRQPRVSDLAWSLLRRMADQNAVLAECEDPWCPRFHLVTRNIAGEVVHTMTMNMLAAAGLIKRCRTSKASYTVSDKGHMALLRRRLDKEAVRGLLQEELLVFEDNQAACEVG